MMVPIYFHILEYRKFPPNQRREAYPLLTDIHESSGIGWGLISTGLFIVVINFIGPYNSMINPGSASTTTNMIYYGLSRPAWVFGVSCILFAIFTKHFNFARSILSGRCFRLFAQAVTMAALILVIVIPAIYNSLSMESGMYLTFPFALIFGLGFNITSLLLAIIAGIFLEFPLRRLYQLTLLPYLSHDKLLTKWHQA